MLGRDRLRRGDAEGAIRELSLPLSDPSFPCSDPSSFETSVLSVAVNAWLEMPSDRLASYPPVREGKCGGMLLLASLGLLAATAGRDGDAEHAHYHVHDSE